VAEPPTPLPPVDGRSLTLAALGRVAAGEAPPPLAPAARAHMAETRAVVDAVVARGTAVYGVTTGFGKLSDVAIAPGRLRDLQRNLVRSHAPAWGRRCRCARCAR
jgi:histidine ammonia-lyase